MAGIVLASCLACVAIPARAQELEPRAYSPSPVGLNIGIVADSVSTGDVAFDPSIPIQSGRANLNVSAVGYVRTLGILGHSANIGLSVPYVHGNLDGLYLGQYVEAHRSAFGDPRFRFAVNLYGAPAMSPREFATYHQDTIVGASLVVAAPLGAYDSTKLVNVGSNRWAFKPEVGMSRATGHWILEGDVGAWFFTDNTDFYGGKDRAQAPIGSLQLHAIYTIRPLMWIAVDGTYYTGGRTTINGAQNYDLQQNSRVGVTFALPIARLQSIKIAYSRGARTTIGGDFQTIGIAYQFIWADRR